MTLNTQKERIHQLFFSLGKENKALAFALAKTIDYYEDFLETIYQRLLDIPHFEDAIVLFREIHKEQEADENIPIPTGLKLKESYVHSFFENYLQEQVYLDGYDNLRLNHFPTILLQCNYIKVLILGSNDIKHIPDEIAALSELVELDLSYNTALNHLPDSMGQLKKLEKLYLKGMHDILLNGISYDDFEEDTAHLLPTFPKCIRQMTRLKHFYLDDAWIKSIPTWIKELTQLETLSFKTGDGGTPYLLIPSTITQLAHLKQLEFNGFTIEIPSSINQLQSLTHLTATGAFFIPDSLKYLKNLTYLDLSFFDPSLDLKIKGFNTAEDLYDKSIPANNSRLDLYGWQWLKEMTWLKQFKFHHIEPFALSAVEIAELQQALPHCKLDIEER